MLGQKIKKAIDQSDLSAEQVAAHTGMSLTNLYKIYKRDSIDSNYLKKLCEILNLSYSYFLDEGPKTSGSNFQSGVGNAAGNNINQKIMSPGNEGIDMASSDSNIQNLQHQLELCQSEKASLEQKLLLKDEIIELLRGRKGKV